MENRKELYEAMSGDYDVESMTFFELLAKHSRRKLEIRKALSESKIQRLFPKKRGFNTKKIFFII